MSGQPVGAVAEIWRYPVKSLGGERLDRIEVTARGLRGDRALALFDRETGKVISAKDPRKWPGLLGFLAAKWPDVCITLPDGGEVWAGDAGADGRLSSTLGRPIALRSLPAGRATFDAYWPGDGRVTEEGLLPGTLFDAGVVHLVTTASLRRLSAGCPGSLFDPRRFRPNLVIDAGDPAGFPENGWLGRVLTTAGGVLLRVTGPCPRCVMTTLAQPCLPADPNVLRAAARLNGGSVGVYAAVEAAGFVRAGEGLSLA
jgi:uncharacterized protein YcbX